MILTWSFKFSIRTLHLSSSDLQQATSTTESSKLDLSDLLSEIRRLRLQMESMMDNNNVLRRKLDQLTKNAGKDFSAANEGVSNSPFNFLCYSLCSAFSTNHQHHDHLSGWSQNDASHLRGSIQAWAFFSTIACMPTDVQDPEVFGNNFSSRVF